MCFAYPQGFTLAGNAGTQAQAEIRGPVIGSGPEPLFAGLSVAFSPYQGQELSAFVDELLKAQVPADFPAQVERKQMTLAGHAAEVLEPMPGRLSSRMVVIDNAPQGYHILTFWPSFKDTPAGQMTADAVQAQRDMAALYEIVAASFTTLPPPGVPINPAMRLDLPQSCLVDGQPLYIDTDDNDCFVLTPQMAARREANGRVGFYGPAGDKGSEPLRVELGITVEVAARDAVLDKIVADYVASHKDLAPKITRSTLTMGGVPAVWLANVPGRPAATEILLLLDGTLFQFRFTPDQGQDVSDLIRAVTGSFGTLPGR